LTLNKSLINSKKKVDQLEKKFDQLEKKVDRLEKKQGRTDERQARVLVSELFGSSYGERRLIINLYDLANWFDKSGISEIVVDWVKKMKKEAVKIRDTDPKIRNLVMDNLTTEFMKRKDFAIETCKGQGLSLINWKANNTFCFEREIDMRGRFQVVGKRVIIEIGEFKSRLNDPSSVIHRLKENLNLLGLSAKILFSTTSLTLIGRIFYFFAECPTNDSLETKLDEEFSIYYHRL